MGRTDSEAAFQEFLKRIPSATNLAAAANASQQLEQQQQLAQQAQQLLGNAAAVASSAPASGPPPTALPDASAGFPGMPRVPSLDLLKQYVQLANAGISSQPAAKAESGGVPTRATSSNPTSSGDGPTPRHGGNHVQSATFSSGASIPPGSVPGLPTPVDASTLQAAQLSAALQGVPGLGPPSSSLLALNPAAAAAALQLNTLNTLRMGSSSGGMVDKDTHEKQEYRRQRR
jgi:hypothetical protein